MGRVICTGLGPGAQDLISVRADRLIRAARHVAYFRKPGRTGMARQIVEGMLSASVTEHAMEYPVTTEIPFGDPEYARLLSDFYDLWAARIAGLCASDDVIVLCEGDPFLYGSFMHLYTRLKPGVEVEVVPGIPGMAGCWNATGIPVTWGDDVLAVVPGTLPEEELVAQFRSAAALVVMKTGRNLPRIRRALEQAGRLEQAWLVERGTMPGQRVMPLAEMDGSDCPYFAIVIVHGQGRRPERKE